MVNAQVREVDSLRPRLDDHTYYPGLYRNDEGGRISLFQSYEARVEQNLQLVEVPIASRMNLDKRRANLTRVKNRDGPIHPNDRARLVRTELNDPGPFRAVLPVDSTTGHTDGVAGVMYHPEGNPQAFYRAPMEPLDRDGRQALHRWQDDGAYTHRVDTWPPRDENSQDLRDYEARYVRERKPKKRR